MLEMLFQFEMLINQCHIYLYARWFRLGSISASNSVNNLRNFDGNLSQLCVSREQALLANPITTAKKAFKF